MVWVTSAEYKSGFVIDIVFSDKTHGLIDFKKTLEGDHRAVVRELLDLFVFSSFSASLDTIVWPNGVDFAPEFLYELAQKSESVA